MSAEIIRRIAKNLDEKVQEQNLGNPFFKDPRYRYFRFPRVTSKP
jgi:hypothetical protein